MTFIFPILVYLFRPTGVLSALRHDTIVGEGNPDYALVETEAERVAKEAVIFVWNSKSAQLTTLIFF